MIPLNYIGELGGIFNIIRLDGLTYLVANFFGPLGISLGAVL